MEKLPNLTLAEVRELAQKLAKSSRGRKRVIGLTGDLGSGKTTFTKSFARALGIKNIKSPTFIIAAAHNAKSGLLHHIDLYRLQTVKDLDHLGLDEILNAPKNVVIIEWADKFKEIYDQCNLIISFKVRDKTHRDVTIEHR